MPLYRIASHTDCTVQYCNVISLEPLNVEQLRIHDPYATSESTPTKHFPSRQRLSIALSTIDQIECKHFGSVSTVYNAKLSSRSRGRPRMLSKETNSNSPGGPPADHYCMILQGADIERRSLPGNERQSICEYIWKLTRKRRTSYS
jgi:hypothetical protein